MKQFKTLKGLKNYVKDYLINEYGSLEEIAEHSIIELMNTEVEESVKEYAKNYVDITYKESKILYNEIDYASNYEELQYYLVCDVLDYMIVDVDKTVNQVKKDYLK